MKRKRKAGRPSTQPQPTSRLLGPTFRWLKLEEPARSFRAMQAFARVAPHPLAERMRAERLKGVTLFIRCESSAVTHSLHLMKAQLLEKLQRTPGGESVREFRCNVGPLDEVPGWESPPPILATEESVHELPTEVAHALGEVADEELRRSLSRLFGKLGAQARQG